MSTQRITKAMVERAAKAAWEAERKLSEARTDSPLIGWDEWSEDEHDRDNDGLNKDERRAVMRAGLKAAR
jgi:hypothetical protein